MHQKQNGQGNGLGQQRNKAQLQSTPQGKMRAEEQEINTPHSGPPPISEGRHSIERLVLHGKVLERSRGALGFPDRT